MEFCLYLRRTERDYKKKKKKNFEHGRVTRKRRAIRTA